MEKSVAKQQFDYWTHMLGLEHTFSFDEAWDYVEHKREIAINKERFEKGIVKVEEKMIASKRGLTGKALEKVNPLKHTFSDGLYIREIFNPKGELLVTKIHNKTHPFFLLKGEMTVLSEEGEIHIKAPYYGVTKAGTKRIIYANEDCIFVTVHVTDKTNLDEIEKEVIAKDFNEVDK
jgi:hypothetical protein|tara:strand:- start:117 stop:647 length:531 start_codon:yes stop_codon:yes gene_type:complete